MNSLIKKEGDFLRLFLSTSPQQRKALINTIGRSQMSAVVQCIYNVLVGNSELAPQITKKVSKYKNNIRKFVSREITFNQRKRLLLKLSQEILILLKCVKSEL